jgi:UDP-2-acetamido-3-amino-2,3-dideoxy-glucuronate N-acetyltransferase
LPGKVQKKYFAVMSDTTIFIHPSAVVDEGAAIGAGSSVWHFCHLSATCRIGENCTIGQNVFIDNNSVVGNRVKIQNNVSVYDGVIIEDDVFIGPSVVFTNVINPRSAVSRKNEFRQTIVKRGASIGANATIICGIEIGEYAFIGAGAVVTKSVAAYALLTGNPAKQTGWMSAYGQKLNFSNDGKATCPQSREEYVLVHHKVTRIK